MNYYEEFGLAQNTSLEEIHQAYRALARLLHPDNQSDPKLKSAGERQMIRLNEILATMSDPEKRRQYDESLCQKLLVRDAYPAPMRIHPLRRYGPWILAGCILTGAGAWYLRSNEFGDVAAVAAPLQPVQVPLNTNLLPNVNLLPKVKVLARPKSSRLRQMVHSDYRRADVRRLNPIPQRREPSAQDEVQQMEVAPAPEITTLPETPLPLRPTVVQPVRATFSGRWFYAPDVHEPRMSGLYRPEFIEFFLSEEQGVLTGKYWARYRIPDKAVSPEVKFGVTGSRGQDANKGDTTLIWVSGDGAKGQIKIALHDPNSMEVNWWTTALGPQTALTSGTAMLVRQQTR